jgi:hypothetical protein
MIGKERKVHCKKRLLVFSRTGKTITFFYSVGGGRRKRRNVMGVGREGDEGGRGRMGRGWEI